MPFSTQNQITIEKTPKYLVDKQVPRRVHKMNPHIKLIVVLRNPVVRAVSEYVQSKENKLRKRRNLNARSIANVNDSIRFQEMTFDKYNRVRTDKPLIRNGLYVEHLKHWLDYFPIEQFLFVNGEQLIQDPSIELERAQAFLGLRPLIRRQHFVYGIREGFPCILKPLESQQVRCLNDQKGRKHPWIEESLLNELNNFYKPYNKLLFELIGQSPWWS